MPAHRYVEETGLAAILATKRSTGVTPEVNLRECVTCMPLPSANKAAHSGFETQRRYHQKFKTVVSVAPQKGLMSSKSADPLGEFAKYAHLAARHEVVSNQCDYSLLDI